MNDARPATASAIRTAGVVAIILSLAAAILFPVSAGIHPIALALAAAGAIVGVLDLVNARQQTGKLSVLGLAAIIVGVVVDHAVSVARRSGRGRSRPAAGRDSATARTFGAPACTPRAAS